MALFTAVGTALGASAATAFGTGLAVTAGAGAVGYSLYSADQSAKAAKKAQESNMAPMPTSPAPVAPTMADASKAASLKLEDQKRALARNETTFTNPLGLKDEADVVRKTLLGG